jgi:hypothetical protein
MSYPGHQDYSRARRIYIALTKTQQRTSRYKIQVMAWVD